MGEELLMAISDCHKNLAGIVSLSYLSEEYAQMIDMVFMPLLEGVEKPVDGKLPAGPAINSLERNALVSFFIDLLDRLGSEKDLAPQKRLALENATDKFERHVISFMCAPRRGGGGLEQVFAELPSYLDAIRFMLRRKSRGILELRERVRGGVDKYPILEGIMRKMGEEERARAEVGKKKEYFSTQEVRPGT